MIFILEFSFGWVLLYKGLWNFDLNLYNWLFKFFVWVFVFVFGYKGIINFGVLNINLLMSLSVLNFVFIYLFFCFGIVR